MQPVSPVLGEDYKPFEAVIAKDQPQYLPLPVLRSPEGVLLSRWRLSDEERAAIADGADIMLSNWTFNQRLQPVRIEVCGDHPRDIATLAGRMSLPVFDTSLPDGTVFSEKTIQVPELTKSQETALASI